MIVYVSLIDMSGDDYGKVFAPQLIGKLNTDGVCDVGGYVDSINEGIILKALKAQKSKKSIILVSHRESTMAIADRIYRVEAGRMYEN